MDQLELERLRESITDPYWFVEDIADRLKALVELESVERWRGRSAVLNITVAEEEGIPFILLFCVTCRQPNSLRNVLYYDTQSA